jgi:homoserine kinase type II
VETTDQTVNWSAAIEPDLDPHQSDVVSAILSARWSLDEPIRLEPVAAGVNNRSWLVTTASDSFVLKTYRDVTDPDRLAFEHALLGALDAARLPFAVPAPIPASSGVTAVAVGDERWSLFRRISGRAAERDSEPDARRAGEALATLHVALASVALHPAMPVPDTYGDLASVHPAVPDPVGALDRLLGAEVAMLAAGAMARWHELTAGWPTQLIHTDFYPANVLVTGDAVSGILDFEYAGRGHRAMDVAIGLAAFSTGDVLDGWSWPVFDAFAGGYLSRLPLGRDEIEAIPLLMLAREATSLVHWLGRHAHDLTDRADIEDRGLRLLVLDRWLEGNQDRLVHVLRDLNRA